MNWINQITGRNHAMESGKIAPLKSKLAWKKTKEILSADLCQNLQRSLSPKEKFFIGDKSNLDYIVIDKDNIPANFVKLFELDVNSMDVQNQVKSIFNGARLLDPSSHSARIVFVEDKIVIFRNEQRLVHKQSKDLTQGEKKRSETVTTFNTFSNIYDAVRSQYYIIKNSNDKQDDCKKYQQQLLKIAQEFRILGIQNIKDGEWKKKIDHIIHDTENARNFRVLAANLQNLKNLTLKNPIIDSNLLEGAKNKFKKRFDDLQGILGVVIGQLNEMENILTEHENLLEMFLAQIKITDRNMAFDNYLKGYTRLKNRYGDISPFSMFFDWINKYRLDENNLCKFVNAVDVLLSDYKIEHKQKLSGKDVKFESFDEVKDNLKSMEELILKSHSE